MEYCWRLEWFYKKHPFSESGRPQLKLCLSKEEQSRIPFYISMWTILLILIHQKLKAVTLHPHYHTLLLMTKRNTTSCHFKLYNLYRHPNSYDTTIQQLYAIIHTLYAQMCPYVQFLGIIVFLGFIIIIYFICKELRPFIPSFYIFFLFIFFFSPSTNNSSRVCIVYIYT